MITVSMGDNSTVYTFPWINIKIAGRAVETFVGKFDEGHEGGYTKNMPAG
jgi:hypothetical protein